MEKTNFDRVTEYFKEHKLYSETYKIAAAEILNRYQTEQLNITVVTNSGLPEWLDINTRVAAKDTWNSHKTTDDGLRVKAIKLIQKRALCCGYKIGIKKAMDLLKNHCL